MSGSERDGAVCTTAATGRRSSRGRESAPDGVGERGERERTSERRLHDGGYGTNEEVAADVESALNGVGEWSERERASERRLHDGGYGTEK